MKKDSLCNVTEPNETKFSDLILDSFEANNVKGAITIDPRCFDSDSKKHNVRYRITYNRERKYIPAGYSYTPNDWELLNSKKLRNEAFKAERDSMLKQLEITKEKVIEIFKDGKDFSFDLLFTYIGKKEKNDIFGHFDEKIQKLIDKNKLSTAESYISTFASLWTFHNHYKGSQPFREMYKTGEWKKGKRLNVKSINKEYIEKFVKHLETDDRIIPGRKKSMPKSKATIGIYLRTFRAILNDMKVPAQHYPFKGEDKEKFKIQKIKGRKVALRKNIMQQIESLPLSGKNQLYRDLFIFSYLCNGANLVDVFSLKHSNIQGKFILFYRTKTRDNANEPIETKVFFSEDMKKIIERHGAQNSEGYLFPFFVGKSDDKTKMRIVADYNRRCNRLLKKIAKMLGIDANLSMITARHSFAVNSERNGQRISVISKGMAHGSISTTQDYLNSFDDDEIIENSLLS